MKNAEPVSLWSVAKRTQRTVEKLKKIYSELCSSGTKNVREAFFADNFHAVLARAEKRPSQSLKEKFVIDDGGFSLAKSLINASDTHFPDTDSALLILSSAISGRRLYGSETEYLEPCLSAVLIEKIYSCLKSSDDGLIRFMSLLSDLGNIDYAKINEVLNPVAIKLSADPAYKISDPRTKAAYREAVYLSSARTRTDELEICNRILSGGKSGISGLLSPEGRYLSPACAVFSLFAIIIAAALISVYLSAKADALFLAPLIFLPAAEALRPFSDRILSRKKGFSRLMRLDKNAEELKSARAAIVLSAQIRGAEDAASLYDKLLRLYCLDPAENIAVCALLDLPAEQVPISPEDRFAAESLKEITTRLNRISPGRFSCILRKRTFSETQQEYMGANRKRGAISELVKYIKTGESDFYAAVGAYENLRGIGYICAVDSDTLPLMDSVSELLSIALHPENRAVFRDGRQAGGYGIICPRMVTRLGDSLRTEFSKSLGGIGSRSSYDSEAASLYQDVFGRGTFCGKGLIDVEALYSHLDELSGERILSHDILEGELLKTAYAGDVCFTEGFPKSPQSYYRRADRWIRGDIQNIPEIFSSRFDALSKIKLLDNIRRALTPVSVFFAFFPGFFLLPPSGAIVAFSSLILWLFPSFLGTFSSLIRERSFRRSYYSGLISSASQGLRYILYSILTLPILAVKSAGAAIKAIFRLITKRNLLEWTTADEADRLGAFPLGFYLLPEILSLILIASPDYFIRLFGAAASLSPLLLSSRPDSKREAPLRYRDARDLSKQLADMWGFFENYVTYEDNYLPPDNVQFSPVYRVAHRTSPTNIGLYMLSVLAAYDRKLITRESLSNRLEKTLSTVERLEKYRGNLYNWYDTKSLGICPPAFVSSVDSGNFTVCLVTLKEGLREIGESVRPLYFRICKLIDETDLSAFYDPVRGLMTIGIERDGKPARGRYDYLMSESRLTSFWAIASRQVPKEHWGRLSRAMLSSGFFGGAASYSGTMFEYFMPEIFIKSPEGSLLSESLRYALGVQKKYAAKFRRPYGISESGYYSFDPALNYRYSAHGVPNTGIKRGLEQNYVVSPYSTYLSYSYSPAEAAENLRRLSDHGMYGAYGLYEALDFSSEAGPPQAVRSYMSHHVGMSVLSADNVLGGGIMQKRFMRDLRSSGALELCDERFHLGAAVFENTLRRPANSYSEPEITDTEVFDEIDPENPRVKLISNGEATLCITDGGVSRFIYRSKNVYLSPKDPILRPQGFFVFIGDGNRIIPAAGETAEFSRDGAAFYKNTDRLSAGMKVSLHRDFSCEIRRFILKNETAGRLDSSVILYLDPSLQDDRAEKVHPAYSKMFLRIKKCPEWDAVTVTRLREDQKLYFAVGFIEEIEKVICLDRGEVLNYPDGLGSIINRVEKIGESSKSVPDPCVYINASIAIPPRTEAELSMFIICAESESELINRLSLIRRKKPRLCELPRLDGVSGRVASAILPEILYGGRMGKIRAEAVIKNRLPLTALWEISASTDLPAVMIDLNGRGDRQKLEAYLGAYKLLMRCGIGLQIIVCYDDAGRYEREHYSELVEAAKDLGVEGSVYSSGGILPLDLSKAREGMRELCRAYSCHICTDGIIDEREDIKRKEYLEILPSSPAAQPVDEYVACGGFNKEGGYVINEKTPLPWCHVLSNPVFGTLISNNSLGFTFAFNSRENRLTPWDNDPARDNCGERLLIKIKNKYFDLIKGSAAVFSLGKADYYASGEDYSSHAEVQVSEKGMSKRIRVEISAPDEAELILYTEPCIGENRAAASMIIPKKLENGLLLHAPASETGGYMYLSCDKPVTANTDRGEILSGITNGEVMPSGDFAAAIALKPIGKTAEFFISFAMSESAAIKMPSLFKEQKDEYFNEKNRIMPWLRYQTLHGRIYAKTGFYQCSGAFGFRDQLQDCCGIAKIYPNELKAQILRCCMAQFPEGDVLHWVHSIPGKKRRGVRTKITDDALWLPYAVCEYIDKTGDSSILKLEAAYCEGIEIQSGENERYGEVYKTARRESVYLHCKRAIDERAGKTGSHGLMLIGCGDWNDGFNKVGEKGLGESVWLTEFYIAVTERFSKAAELMGDFKYSESLKEYSDALRESVETAGRGALWYLRGYFDGGEPLGSEKNSECRIDSVAQSFAQFAGLGSGGFLKEALMNAYRELYEPKSGTVKLFTPAFSDGARPDPGYVKSYPDGIRENGGQYTHAAVWLAMAMKRAGLEKEAEELIEALNPINRSKNGGHEIYKTEPYYLCGDVYTHPDCCGRGGWSIYTGAAGWLYRAMGE